MPLYGCDNANWFESDRDRAAAEGWRLMFRKNVKGVIQQAWIETEATSGVLTEVIHVRLKLQADKLWCARALSILDRGKLYEEKTA